jgi:hypothetical protein
MSSPSDRARLEAEVERLSKERSEAAREAKYWKAAESTSARIAAEFEKEVEKLTSQRNYWKHIAERAAELLSPDVPATFDWPAKRDQWLKDAQL